MQEGKSEEVQSPQKQSKGKMDKFRTDRVIGEPETRATVLAVNFFPKPGGCKSLGGKQAQIKYTQFAFSVFKGIQR